MGPLVSVRSQLDHEHSSPTEQAPFRVSGSGVMSHPDPID